MLKELNNRLKQRKQRKGWRSTITKRQRIQG